MQRPNRIDGLAVAIASAILLAACQGGGSTATSSTGGDNATDAPGATTTSGGGAGGGGNTGGGGTVESIDPCTLLTTDEVGAAYEETGVTTFPTEGFYGKLCAYMPSSGKIAMMYIAIEPFAERPCDKYKGGPSTIDIADLGDWAYWFGDGGELYVKTGDRCLYLRDDFNAFGDSTRDTFYDLARKALARL